MTTGDSITAAATLTLLIACAAGRNAEEPALDEASSSNREQVVLRGRVLDTAGGPIAGATVRYVPDASTLEAMGFDPVVEERHSDALDFGSLPLEALSSSEAGSDGSFEVSAWRVAGRPAYASGSGPWWVGGLLVTKAGHATRMLFHDFTDPPSHDFGDVELLPETRLSGVVVDQEGRPLAGVEARLDECFRWDPGRRWDTFGRVYRIGGLDLTETDEAGHFELAGLDSGHLYFTLRREDGARRTLRAFANADRVDFGRIVLPAAGAISGSIVDARGRPVPGADVWLADASFDWERIPALVLGIPRYTEGEDWTRDQIRALSEEGAPHASSDESGRFTLSGRGSLTYDVYVHVPGYEVVRIEDVEVGRSDLRLSLGGDTPRFRPERTLSVSLVDEDGGDSIIGGSVTALRVVDRESIDYPVELHAERRVATELPVSEAEDGSFMVRGLGPVGTRLHAEAPGYKRVRANVIGLPDTTVRLSLERASSVSGRVIDPSGEPRAGVEVFVIPDRLLSWPGSGEPTARSDEHGEFRVEGLSSGAVVLLARADGVGTSDGDRLDFGGIARHEDLSLTLRRFGSVEGVALRPDGSIAPYAWVDLEATGDGDGWRGHPPQETRADPRGRFVFDEVPPGRYRAGVGRDRWRPSGDVEVRAGERSVVDVTPQEQSRIAGRVASGGKPVAWADVNGIKDDDPFAFFFSWTREDGRFDAVAERTGTYSLSVETLQGGRSQVRTVEVAQGELAQVDFSLPTGKVLGTVVSSEEGSPMGAVLLGLAAPDGDVLAQDLTNGRGEFSFAHLFDGAYVVRVWPHQMGAEDVGPGFVGGEWTVDVRNGATTTRTIEVPRGLSVAGTVRTPKGTLARDGTEVDLVRTDSENPFDFLSEGYSAVTYTWRGGYRVSGLAPGSYRLLVEAESPQEVRERGASVELRGTDAEVIDLTLLGAGPRPPLLED